jgi:hypothetical protein
MSFELPVSKIRVELSYFYVCVQRGLLSAGIHVRAENVFDRKLFSQGFESEWFMDLLRTKMLRRVYRQISRCYC